MAKKDEAVAVPEAAPEEMTLDEFLIRLSNTDRRPELLSGFYFVESRASRIKDTEAAFRGRFAAYINTPV
jgi:hypothetical protein